MTVKKIYTLGGVYAVSGVGYQPDGEISGDWNNDAAVIETLKAGFLCNDSQLVEKEGQWVIQGDPTEGALLVVARKVLSTLIIHPSLPGWILSRLIRGTNIWPHYTRMVRFT
jgi:magnesium-transporting ATPase (P-type)